MYKRSILTVALAFVIFLSGSLNALAEAYGVVTSKGLSLRALPTTDSQQLGTYSTGTAVELRGYVDGWYWVRVGDGTGYMSAQYVSRATPGYVDNRGKYVNLRAEPSYRAPVLMQAQSFTPLAVLGRSGAFYRVVVSGHIGYMDAKLVQTEDAELETDAELYQWIVGSDAVVQQVGRTEADVEYDEHLSLNVQYPRTDCAALDDALKRFVREKEREARDMLGAVGVDGDEVEVELSLSYDAYRIGERYATVMENGFLMSSFMAHQEDLALAVTADLQTGKLLTADDILTEAGKAVALKLLTDRLSQVYGAMDDAQADESWLSNCALLPSGVAVVFVRGDLLPSALGTLRVILPYAELGAAGALSPELDIAQVQEIKSDVSDYDVTQEQTRPVQTQAPAETAVRRIDPDKPMIALTFDDGPSEVTPRILAALDEVDGRATFCVVGNRVANYEDVVLQVAQQGSEIACHTWSHKKLTTLSQEGIARELERTIAAVGKVANAPVRVLRPPYGSVNKDVRAVTRSMNMLIASWSVDTLDWSTRNEEKTYRAIMKGAKNGSIILCHDVYETTAAAVERAIQELSAQGYQFVTFSELMSFHKNGVKAGSVYSHLAPENIER